MGYTIQILGVNTKEPMDDDPVLNPEVFDAEAIHEYERLLLRQHRELTDLASQHAQQRIRLAARLRRAVEVSR